MAQRIVWTVSAWRELQNAAAFIAEDSPRYAVALVDEAKSAARSLRRFPQRGRAVPEIDDPAVRELFVKRYRLIYEILQDHIVILAFLHGARQFPETLA